MGSCGEPVLKQDNGFTLEFPGGKSVVKVNENLQLGLTNDKGTAVDSVTYFVDDVRVASSADGNAQINFPDGKVGVRNILGRVYSGDKRFAISQKVTLLAEVAPKAYSYEILESYPHDSEAFTQGIEFAGDTLYESTGQYGQSTLRRVDYLSGEVLKKVPLATDQFGEGLTIINDKVHQLTWQNRIGLTYSLDSLVKQEVFFYNNSTQGWGLCNDGEKIYKSDGTSRIWILNPETMLEEDYIEIYTHTSKIDNINELEFIDGKIYANVWQRDAIAIINPETGVVEGVINTSALKNEVSRSSSDNVLNGIAYKGEPGILYLTGKRWEKLFKVRISESQ